MSKAKNYHNEGGYKVEKVNDGLYIVVNAYEKRDNYFSRSVINSEISNAKNSQGNKENSTSTHDNPTSEKIKL